MGGEKEENDEEGAEEENINEENKNEESVNESEKKNEEAQQPTNNAHLIKQIGPITIDSTPPEKPTRHRDVAESMRGSVLSRCPIVDCIFLQNRNHFSAFEAGFPDILELWSERVDHGCSTSTRVSFTPCVSSHPSPLSLFQI